MTSRCAIARAVNNNFTGICSYYWTVAEAVSSVMQWRLLQRLCLWHIRSYELLIWLGALYTVYTLQESCDCRSTCIHMYCCSCIDSTLHATPMDYIIKRNEHYCNYPKYCSEFFQDSENSGGSQLRLDAMAMQTDSNGVSHNIHVCMFASVINTHCR